MSTGIAQNVSVDVSWGTLSALRWPGGQSQRMLCLHGWMDNAASFAPLAEHLVGWDLVALELAGHGHSDHRPHGAHYYLTENLFDLDAALNSLGWEDCVLVGHSLGGGIASAYAAGAPERIRALVLLDGMGLIPEAPGDCPARLRDSIKSVRNPREHRRVYADVVQAARTRQAKSPMRDSSAMALAGRALYEAEDGYRWRTDPGLMWKSPILPTEEQARALLAGIECPVLAVTTSMLAGYLGEHLVNRAAVIADIEHHEIDGDHHVHMDEPGAVAGLIKAFLDANGDST